MAVNTALTIAGSDPSGGAGIQSDLKTFSRLQVDGMAVIAALTAQNAHAVTGVAELAPEFVGKQLDAIFCERSPDAAKTGMLLTAGVVAVVAAKFKEWNFSQLVVDPVMVSTSGTKLLNPDAMDTFRRALLPLALVVTPNLHEAGVLTGKTVSDIEDMEEAALHIHGLGAKNVLIKGGHGQGAESVDVLFDGSSFIHLRAPRLVAENTHGTGCVLSAAITAHLAQGLELEQAVRLGKVFVTDYIKSKSQRRD